MPLCETGSRNDGQSHFAEGFQQAFRRGLSGPAFGIASKETRQFLLLCCETLAHHAFQQGQHAQGKRTKPTRWSSRWTYKGANDNGWPLRREKLRSTRYSSR